METGNPIVIAKTETAALRRDEELRAQDLHEPDRRPHDGEDPDGREEQGPRGPRRTLKWRRNNKLTSE